jgi:hypothetical protein
MLSNIQEEVLLIVKLMGSPECRVIFGKRCSSYSSLWELCNVESYSGRGATHSQVDGNS